MTTQLQVAFDVARTDTALAVLSEAASEIDIIEAGTVLCLHEGLGAVSRLRAEYPDHPIVADIRIGRAGAKFANLAFGAGASIVTVLGESPADVLIGALASARKHGGHVEVELWDAWTEDHVRRWVDLGVHSVIVHRPLGVSAADDEETRRSLDRLARVDLGSTRISLAGGITLSGLDEFDLDQADILVIGSAVVDAADPAAELTAIRRGIERQSERNAS